MNVKQIFNTSLAARRSDYFIKSFSLVNRPVPSYPRRGYISGSCRTSERPSSKIFLELGTRTKRKDRRRFAGREMSPLRDQILKQVLLFCGDLRHRGALTTESVFTALSSLKFDDTSPRRAHKKKCRSAHPGCMHNLMSHVTTLN